MGWDGRRRENVKVVKEWEGKEATDLVERESWVAWDGEVGVECYVLDFLLCFSVLCSVSILFIP